MESSTKLHNILLGAGNMAQALKCLPCKHGEVYHNPCDKTQGVAMHTCNLSIRGVEIDRILGLTGQPFWLTQCQENDKNYLRTKKGNKVDVG